MATSLPDASDVQSCTAEDGHIVQARATITASMVYDLIACPHRVTMDLFADHAKRDAVNPFIRTLWEKGAAHEQAVMGDVGISVLDLSGSYGDEKERLTTEACNARSQQSTQAGSSRTIWWANLISCAGWVTAMWLATSNLALARNVGKTC